MVCFTQKRNQTIMNDSIGCGLRWNPNKKTMWLIVQVWFSSKSKLNYLDQSDRMQSIMKIRLGNDMINHTGVVYDQKETRQQRDRSYKSTLCQKQNWIVMTDPIGYGLWRRPEKTITWLIVQVQYTLKSELNCHDQSTKMQFIIKADGTMMWSIVKVWSS